MKLIRKKKQKKTTTLKEHSNTPVKILLHRPHRRHINVSLRQIKMYFAGFKFSACLLLIQEI